MANIKSEQIRSDLSLELDYDQHLSTSLMIKIIENILGKNNCSIERFNNKKLLYKMRFYRLLRRCRLGRTRKNRRLLRL